MQAAVIVRLQAAVIVYLQAAVIDGPDDDLNSTTFIYISEKRINTFEISLTICHVILNGNKMLVFHQVQILSH